MIWKVLKRSYFTTACRSLRYAHEDLKRELKFAEENRLFPPEEAVVAYSTLQRRVESVDKYWRVATREGIARARMVCRTSFLTGYPRKRWRKSRLTIHP